MLGNWLGLGTMPSRVHGLWLRRALQVTPQGSHCCPSTQHARAQGSCFCLGLRAWPSGGLKKQVAYAIARPDTKPKGVLGSGWTWGMGPVFPLAEVSSSTGCGEDKLLPPGHLGQAHVSLSKARNGYSVNWPHGV